MQTARFEFPVLADADVPALLQAAARVRGVLAASAAGATLTALCRTPEALDALEKALLAAFGDAPAVAA